MPLATLSDALPGAPARESLNPLDRILLAIDDVMRSQGGPGFETQALAWLDGRVDVERLRGAVRELGRCHPRLVARLDADRPGVEPSWRLRPGKGCHLGEVDVSSDAPDDVLDLAARLLSVPRGLGVQDPLSFHLVHRPGGRDVLVAQYNHVLMDLHAIPPLLLEVDRLYRSERPGDSERPARERGVDRLAQGLAAIPVERRLRGALSAVDLHGLWRQARHPTALLGNGRERVTGAPALRCLVATLPRDQVETVEARLRRSFGFVSLSMAVLASAYRAVGARTRRQGFADFNLSTGIGVSLGLRGAPALSVGNLAAIMPMHAAAAELADRDGLIRALSGRFRDRLRIRQDWGFVQLGSLALRSPWYLRTTVTRILTQGFSFMYAFFGNALEVLGDTFCGLALEDVLLTAPGCPPAGAHLIGQKFRGRLTLQLAYLPELLSEGAAREFLAALLADLTSP